MPANVYHTVDYVLPGTVTLMECGPLVSTASDWGYKRGNGEVWPADHDPVLTAQFKAALVALNPHLNK